MHPGIEIVCYGSSRLEIFLLCYSSCHHYTVFDVVALMGISQTVTRLFIGTSLQKDIKKGEGSLIPKVNCIPRYSKQIVFTTVFVDTDKNKNVIDMIRNKMLLFYILKNNYKPWSNGNIGKPLLSTGSLLLTQNFLHGTI